MKRASGFAGWKHSLFNRTVLHCWCSMIFTAKYFHVWWHCTIYKAFSHLWSLVCGDRLWGRGLFLTHGACVCVCAKSLQSCPTLCDPMDCSPPGSMGFSRQECWSGLPCPPPGDLPDPRIELASLTFSALAGGFFYCSTTWKPIPTHEVGVNSGFESPTTGAPGTCVWEEIQGSLCSATAQPKVPGSHTHHTPCDSGHTWVLNWLSSPKPRKFSCPSPWGLIFKPEEEEGGAST